MSCNYFVTGTDTGAGKTLVSAGLLRAAAVKGLSCFGLKPVAAGCYWTDDGLRNDDAELLRAASSVQLPYEQVNPIALEPALAPHIAAAQSDCPVALERLTQLCGEALAVPADFRLVEGAGGWRVPINRDHTLADLVQQLRLPVILVVGMRLGCINHACLSAEAIKGDGLELAGWVANGVDPLMLASEENLSALRERLPAPLLGVVPYLNHPDADHAAAHLDLTPLLHSTG